MNYELNDKVEVVMDKNDPEKAHIFGIGLILLPISLWCFSVFYSGPGAVQTEITLKLWNEIMMTPLFVIFSPGMRTPLNYIFIIFLLNRKCFQALCSARF